MTVQEDETGHDHSTSLDVATLRSRSSPPRKVRPHWAHPHGLDPRLFEHAPARPDSRPTCQRCPRSCTVRAGLNVVQPRLGVDKDAEAQYDQAAGIVWPRDPAGIQRGFAHLKLAPRDLAKLGQPSLDGGR